MVTKIALAQISATDDMSANIEKGIAFVKEAADRKANIICFPELSFTKFFPQYKTRSKPFDLAVTVPGQLTDIFCDLAAEYGIVIIINVYEKGDNGKYFDCSPVINSDGKLLGKAHMNHVAEEPLFHEKSYYAPGITGFPVFETDFGKIGLAICYDRHFTEHMRAITLKGADIIFTPQAGIKPNPTRGYELEMQGASFSNQIFIALVNRVGLEDKMDFNGGSFVTEPSGEIFAQAGYIKEELLIADCDLSVIKKLRKERPFLRDRRKELYNILQEI